MKTNLLNECYDKFVTEELREKGKRNDNFFTRIIALVKNKFIC